MMIMVKNCQSIMIILSPVQVYEPAASRWQHTLSTSEMLIWLDSKYCCTYTATAAYNQHVPPPTSLWDKNTSYPNLRLPFPIPSSLCCSPQIQLGNLREHCDFPKLRLRQSPGRNKTGCILAIKFCTVRTSFIKFDVNVTKPELGRFAHRTLNIGNIGAELNIGELVV